MHPTKSRLRLALVALAFVCALALTGVVQQGGVPRGGLSRSVPGSIMQGWPIKYVVPGTGVIVQKPR
jgi:hypothetical protein